MTKKEFLTVLNKQLKQLPLKERQKTLTYYEEIFEDYKEEGLSEERAIVKLGNPVEIADEILGETKVSGKKRPSVLMIILLILGFPLWGALILAAICLLLSVCILIWMPVIVLGFSGVSFLVVGVVGMIGAPFVMIESLGIGIVQLGSAVLAVGLCIATTVLCAYLVKYLVKATLWLTGKLVELFKKQEVL